MGKVRDPAADLERVRRQLDAVHREESRLLARRDVLVDELRGRRLSWVAIARLAGTSRQALYKRR